MIKIVNTVAPYVVQTDLQVSAVSRVASVDKLEKVIALLHLVVYYYATSGFYVDTVSWPVVKSIWTPRSNISTLAYARISFNEDSACQYASCCVHIY